MYVCVRESMCVCVRERERDKVCVEGGSPLCMSYSYSGGREENEERERRGG